MARCGPMGAGSLLHLSRGFPARWHAAHPLLNPLQELRQGPAARDRETGDERAYATRRNQVTSKSPMEGRMTHRDPSQRAITESAKISDPTHRFRGWGSLCPLLAGARATRRGAHCSLHRRAVSAGAGGEPSYAVARRRQVSGIRVRLVVQRATVDPVLDLPLVAGAQATWPRASKGHLRTARRLGFRHLLVQ
jgi:hypothetical protein